MMEFKLTIDITDRLADAIAALAACFADTAQRAERLAQWHEYRPRVPSEERAQDVAGRAEDVPPAVTRPEPEKSRTEAQERVTEPADDARIADCAGEQFHCPTPAHPIPAVGTGDSGATPDPAAPDKPKKKKAPKKPVEAPERVPDAAPAVTQPEPENSRTETQERATEPVPGTPEPEPAASAPDDPMRGMTVIDAVKALVDEIQEKGIDMAQVNARVRAKANEIGLAYASAACLIKAIGYAEARRVALGEK
jgi:hypothetical protein